MRRVLERLYADGFPDDSAAYRRWFLDTYQGCAVVTDDVAAGFLVEKQAVIAGRVQKVFYLDAFSVYTPYRGKGYAAPLMQKLLKKAFDEGATYVFLSPFARDYYRPFGFADVAFGRQYKIGGGLKSVESCPCETLQALYNGGSGNRLLLDERAATDLIESYAVDGLEIVRVGDSCGVVDGDRFDVLCLGAGDIACDALIGLTAKLPDVQVRVVNAAQALEDAAAVGYCGAPKPGRITDGILPNNNLCLGAGETVDVSTLADYVFGIDRAQKAARNRFCDEV